MAILYSQNHHPEQRKPRRRHTSSVGLHLRQHRRKSQSPARTSEPDFLEISFLSALKASPLPHKTRPSGSLIHLESMNVSLDPRSTCLGGCFLRASPPPLVPLSAREERGGGGFIYLSRRSSLYFTAPFKPDTKTDGSSLPPLPGAAAASPTFPPVSRYNADVKRRRHGNSRERAFIYKALGSCREGAR